MSVRNAEGSLFLLAELLFCISFLSACEIPNWTRGPYSANQCVDRWMFAAGLFFPSGLQTSSFPGTNRRKSE
jgi:hypothetical protein